MSSNISDFIRATGSKERTEINKILQYLQDSFAAPAEAEAIHERITFSENPYLHTTGFTFTQFNDYLLLEDDFYLLDPSDNNLHLEVG